MISTLCWVSKGAAAAEPELFEMSREDLAKLKDKMENGPEEVEVMKDMSDEDGSDSEKDVMEEVEMEEENSTLDEENDAFMKSLKLEEYDNEDDGATMFLGGKHVAMYESNIDDPYLANAEAYGDAESDTEDIQVKATDAVLLVGRSDEERNRLEVYIYEDESCNLFVHHDFELPAFPLALSWINTQPKSGEKGNFVAVGTMLPEIEIWNLDVIDVLEPVVVLGGREVTTKKSKKSGKMKEQFIFKEGSHTDSVLSLSYHFEEKFRLCSGSADCTIKLWDISSPELPVLTLEANTIHSGKVQSISCKPNDSNMLLSSSFDCTSAVTDLRSRKSIGFKLEGEAENCNWNPHDLNSFGVSTESGAIQMFDIRAPKKAVYKIAAHKKACSSISFNATIPNLLLSSSLDGILRIWNLESAGAECIVEKKMHVGALFASSFYRDSAFLVATGGSQGTVALWDLLEDPVIRGLYGAKYATPAELEIYNEENEDKAVHMGKEKRKYRRPAKEEEDD